MKVTIVLFENFFLYSVFFYIVLSVTFIISVIYPLFIAVVVVSYLCVYLSSEWQGMRTVELISTGDGQVMATLDNIGIKLFVLAALKER